MIWAALRLGLGPDLTGLQVKKFEYNYFASNRTHKALGNGLGLPLVGFDQMFEYSIFVNTSTKILFLEHFIFGKITKTSHWLNLLSFTSEVIELSKQMKEQCVMKGRNCKIQIDLNNDSKQKSIKDPIITKPERQ